jgi:hypothetical protein
MTRVITSTQTQILTTVVVSKSSFIIIRSFYAMLFLGRVAFAAFLASTTLARDHVTSPSGCLKLPTDSDWPSPEVWKAQLPGVIPSNGKPGPQPNYRLRPKNTAEVQKAVKFAKDNNIRLSIIASGHGIDYSLMLVLVCFIS